MSFSSTQTQFTPKKTKPELYLPQRLRGLVIRKIFRYVSSWFSKTKAAVCVKFVTFAATLQSPKAPHHPKVLFRCIWDGYFCKQRRQTDASTCVACRCSCPLILYEIRTNQVHAYRFETFGGPQFTYITVASKIQICIVIALELS